MREELYDLDAQLSRDHWWWVGRRTLLTALLDRYLDVPTERTILEAGCGHGSNFSMLGRYGDVVGLESYSSGVAYCRRTYPEISILEQAIPEPMERRFDVICLLDVLEHIEDDDRALQWIYDHLNLGGRLFLTVPAFPFLWSEHDRASHRKLRYTRAGLLSKVSERFTIDYESYVNFHLFPVIAAVRVAQRALSPQTPRPDLQRVRPRILNWILTKIFAAERWWNPRFRLPFGVSLFVAASKWAAHEIGGIRERDHELSCRPRRMLC